MTGVLQTWTRDLRYHPHIHYLVPGGALTHTGWVRPKNASILVPAKPLAVRMRNRFRDALKAADFKLYLTIPAKAWRKPWNVDARPVGRGDIRSDVHAVFRVVVVVVGRVCRSGKREHEEGLLGAALGDDGLS